MTERKSNVSPSEIKNRLQSWRYVAQAIIDGLEGKPFSWGDGERTAYTQKAKKMGITLITATQAKKQGYRIKHGAKSVGTAYFRSPISNYGNLYVLECQCVKEEE